MNGPVCRWCGETLEQHTESRTPDAPVPRCPCVGLRSGFLAREAKDKIAPRFFSPIFVHHRGSWHHAPETYSNGADTACGLSRVPGELIALGYFAGACSLGRFRSAVAQEFSAEIARAPMCSGCFPGLRVARLSANLADFVARGGQVTA